MGCPVLQDVFSYYSLIHDLMSERVRSKIRYLDPQNKYFIFRNHP